MLNRFALNAPGGEKDICKKTDIKNEGYLHGADEGHLPQRWFSSGPGAEIHPSQNRCHSGSMGGSGPVTHTKPTGFSSRNKQH